MFLINSRQEIFRCGPPPEGFGQALSRSYGRFFAEFLKDLSLVRLGLLDLTTCVGLGTEQYAYNLRSFSWKRAPQIGLAVAAPSDLPRSIVIRIYLDNLLSTPAPIQ